MVVVRERHERHAGGHPGGEHDHAPPAEKTAHSETLVVGVTQLSKTPEINMSAWVSFFILGCMPLIFVRNMGGKEVGSKNHRSGRKRTTLQGTHRGGVFGLVSVL